MTGKTILHYRILEKIGEGGMGQVYKAQDTKLKRDVAIKFLPRQIATNDEERERFKIEAQAAAALNHPNIATIYAIEEHDDEMFIVMEYIEGKELKDIVHTNLAKVLNLRKVIDYASQIASGLQAAHEKDVTHRDIKSANIMITDKGQIKIMDFGLAKVRGGAQVTKVGTTLGTAAYMSPEQAQGMETDHRTDIWAFGVVLYEMLTGKLPFGGDYEQAVIYSIMNEEPVHNEIPADFQPILEKAVAKDPQSRYQGIGEVLADLKTLNGFETLSGLKTARTTGRPAPPRNRMVLFGTAVLLIIVISGLAYFLTRNQPIDSIAVLPFVNANNNRDSEYLSDGLTETIINKLSQLPQLKVMARSTVFHFKGKDVSPLEVGRELGVKAVLSGNIVQRGDVLRLQAELVNISDGAQLWGAQYNPKLDDIFSVQSTISEQITGNLRLRLSRNEKDRIARKQTENNEAFKLYLQGRYFWNKRTPGDVKKSLDLFQQAIDNDPSYAMAYAGIADAYNILGAWLFMEPAAAFPKAKAAANKALEIDDSLGEAYAALAYVQYRYDWDFAASEKNFQRAIRLSPSYASARQWYHELLFSLKKDDAAKLELEKALELDPLSLIINVVLAKYYHWALGDHDMAIAQLQKTLEMDPDFAPAHWFIFGAYQGQGEHDMAVRHLVTFLRSIEPQAGKRFSDDYHSVGWAGAVRKGLSRMLENIKKNDQPVSYIFIAMFHVFADDKQKALDYLELVYEKRGPEMTYLTINPVWDPLRNEPRFQDLVKKVGLPQ